MHGEFRISASKNGQEVILEGADGKFGCIAPVLMCWHELIVDLLLFDVVF